MKGWIKVLIVSACLAPVVALAATWWNNDWKYRKEISFDLSPTGADIAGILVKAGIGTPDAVQKWLQLIS